MIRETELALRLGRLDPSSVDLVRAEALAGAGFSPGLFRDIVMSSKVLPAVRHHAELLPGTAAGAVLAALKDESTRLNLAAGRDSALARLREVRAALGAAGERVMAIKGSGLMLLLPDYRLRSMGDLDLLFPDSPSIVTGTRALEEAGYDIIEGGEAPQIVRMRVSPEGSEVLLGHFTVYRDGCKVDMHALNLTVTGCPVSPVDYWRRARAFPIGPGETIWVPCPEDALIILLIHAADHGYVTLKDTNDAYALLSAFGPTLDWDYLARTVADGRLDRILSFLLHLLRRHYGLETQPPSGPRSMLRPSGLLGRALQRTALTWMKRSWLTRAAGASLLGMEYARQEGGDRAGLSLAYSHLLWSARRHFGERWPGRLAERLQRASEAGPFFTPKPPRGRALYLTEVSAELLAAWLRAAIPWEHVRALGERGYDVIDLPEALLVVVRRNSMELVLSPAGMFVPTFNFVFTEEELGRLEALGKEIMRALDREVDW